MSDAEVLQLVAATDWSSVHARQLMRFMLVSNRSTLRVVTNRRLTTTALPDPPKRMRVHGCRPKFSELKQPMPSVTNLDMPFF